MNKAILMGNVGKDPEVRYSQSGGAIVNFSMATQDRYKKDAPAEWHNVVAFGKLADMLSQHLTKGSKCLVEGRIQTRKWTDKNGVERYTTEIIADQFEFAGGKPANPPQRQHATQGRADELDDDVPF